MRDKSRILLLFRNSFNKFNKCKIFYVFYVYGCVCVFNVSSCFYWLVSVSVNVTFLCHTQSFYGYKLCPRDSDLEARCFEHSYTEMDLFQYFKNLTGCHMI